MQGPMGIMGLKYKLYDGWENWFFKPKMDTNRIMWVKAIIRSIFVARNTPAYVMLNGYINAALTFTITVRANYLTNAAPLDILKNDDGLSLFY